MCFRRLEEEERKREEEEKRKEEEKQRRKEKEKVILCSVGLRRLVYSLLGKERAAQERGQASYCQAKGRETSR
jgi:hypothetical protein